MFSCRTIGETVRIINHQAMKLILFLAAIYSLIIHQSQKKAWETVLPGEQKAKTQKVITGKFPASAKLHQQQLALPKDKIEQMSFLSSNNARIAPEWDKKDQQ
jgi:hypothetical protein